MKLEVGQFIRTPYGIRKIVDITKDEGYGKPRVRVIKLDDFLNTGYKFNYEFYTDEKIIKECKSSFNIIDLMKVGDYVNGVEIIKIYEKGDSFAGNCDYIFKEKTIEVCNDNYELIPFEALFTNNDIDTIVTKEQFEQMEYKVGK